MASVAEKGGMATEYSISSGGEKKGEPAASVCHLKLYLLLVYVAWSPLWSIWLTRLAVGHSHVNYRSEFVLWDSSTHT